MKFFEMIHDEWSKNYNERAVARFSLNERGGILNFTIHKYRTGSDGYPRIELQCRLVSVLRFTRSLPLPVPYLFVAR